MGKKLCSEDHRSKNVSLVAAGALVLNGIIPSQLNYLDCKIQHSIWCQNYGEKKCYVYISSTMWLIWYVWNAWVCVCVVYIARKKSEIQKKQANMWKHKEKWITKWIEK